MLTLPGIPKFDLWFLNLAWKSFGLECLCLYTFACLHFMLLFLHFYFCTLLHPIFLSFASPHIHTLQLPQPYTFEHRTFISKGNALLFLICPAFLAAAVAATACWRGILEFGLKVPSCWSQVPRPGRRHSLLHPVSFIVKVPVCGPGSGQFLWLSKSLLIWSDLS